MYKRSKTPEKRPAHRPLANIDLEQLRALAGLQCTIPEVAGVLRVSKSTLDKRLHDDPECREAWDGGREQGKVSVRRHQFKIMEGGNAAMAIFLGKQLLGQRDKIEHDVTTHGGMTLAELVAFTAKLKAERQNKK